MTPAARSATHGTEAAPRGRVASVARVAAWRFAAAALALRRRVTCCPTPAQPKTVPKPRRACSTRRAVCSDEGSEHSAPQSQCPRAVELSGPRQESGADNASGQRQGAPGACPHASRTGEHAATESGALAKGPAAAPALTRRAFGVVDAGVRACELASKPSVAELDQRDRGAAAGAPGASACSHGLALPSSACQRAGALHSRPPTVETTAAA